MYNREEFKFIRDTISHTVASTSAGSIDTKTLNSTTLGAISGRVFGEIFEITLKCTTGELHVGVYNPAVPLTTAIGFVLTEGEEISFKAKTAVPVMGDSTTAAFTAIIWGYTPN